MKPTNDGIVTFGMNDLKMAAAGCSILPHNPSYPKDRFYSNLIRCCRLIGAGLAGETDVSALQTPQK